MRAAARRRGAGAGLGHLPERGWRGGQPGRGAAGDERAAGLRRRHHGAHPVGGAPAPVAEPGAEPAAGAAHGARAPRRAGRPPLRAAHRGGARSGRRAPRRTAAGRGHGRRAGQRPAHGCRTATERPGARRARPGAGGRAGAPDPGGRRQSDQPQSDPAPARIARTRVGAGGQRPGSAGLLARRSRALRAAADRPAHAGPGRVCARCGDPARRARRPAPADHRLHGQRAGDGCGPLPRGGHGCLHEQAGGAGRPE